VGLVLGTQILSQSVEIASENWEKYRLGDLPDAPWDLKINKHKQGTFEVSEDQSSPFQGGSKSVKLIGLESQGGPSLLLPIQPQTESVVVEFDYFLHHTGSDDGPGMLPSVFLCDSAGFRGLALNLDSAIPSEGRKASIVNQTDTSGMGTEVAGRIFNQWVHAKLSLKAGSDGFTTYDLTITPFDGVAVEASDLALWINLSDISVIEFSWASPVAGGTFYIDNVLISAK
jgi:hypothetical protein